MKCRKCGAELLDTDTFCVKCGQRVEGPMLCSSCGEQLRDGERFCHKCGAPVESAPEDDEIPLSRQKTVDIPFDQIEQGILLEAKQAIVKRPQENRSERRNPEDYSRPRAEEPAEYRRDPGDFRKPRSDREEPYRDGESYRPGPRRNAGYGEDVDDERYEAPRRPARRMPPEYREEEVYDDDDEDEEDSGDSKMRIITIILGIAVVAIGLAIGFIFWQRNRTPGSDGPGETAGQDIGEDGAEDGEGGAGASANVQGRIQILSNVNVRNKPTTEDSEVLMVAKTGETYEYYELVEDAWYHIKLEDGKEGYVSKNYVEDLQ